MGSAAGDRTLGDALVALLGAPDEEALLARAVEAAEPGSARGAGVLHRLGRDGVLRIAAQREFTDDFLAPYRLLPVDSPLPAARAVRQRRPVYSTAGDFPRATSDALEEGLKRLRVADEFVSLPLLVDGGCLGALSLPLPAGSSLDAAREHRLTTVAAVCANRWERLLLAGAPGSGQATAAQPPATGAVTEPGAGPAGPPAVAEGRGRATMLELAMSNAHIGTFDWDFPSGRLVWDERLCELFGISPEAFDGRIETFFGLLHPDDRATVDAAVAESHRTGSYQVTYRVVRPDGGVRWVDAESSVVYDGHGQPQGMIGVVQDRTEEHDRGERREARREFILSLTRSLVAALTTEDIIATVAETAVPALGGTTMAVFLREDGGRLRLAGARGYDAEGTGHLRRISEVAHQHPVFADLRAGVPMFVESADAYRERIADERLGPRPGQQAWAILPLVSAEGLVGTCVITYDRPRTFSPDDRTVFAAAAGILGQSLARARLYDARRAYLTELQQLMLPRRLPELSGAELAVRYRPGAEGLDVGGDWYDVLPLPDGRVVFVIGDVQGHSAPAAAVMGQLRTAMGTQAAGARGPGGLLGRANRFLCDLDTDLFATCCVVEADPAAGRLRVARAGHPLPVLLEPGRPPLELATPGGMPLGCFPDDTHPVTEVQLTPGAALLLYTDGLVERPGSDYASGVAALLERLDADRDLELGTLADRLVAPAAARAQHDDIAVLLLRRAR
ncbi:SpoIIE family protein phosphatase [Streptomyces sp. TRM 70351]|uniref:SpoIIE family protein phosphatase n=1 Tax=Streptomyces sp. TRM 70351 TaxID=3116552 RepID=UPI002E7B05C2|nr:SpoIIE family protein phosphatase [Streptomyces sp. TRM 70351]MEE1928496.1 SpoIIE family protein phosphatase [Streptomyces sp. TRM 70351]